MAKAPETDNPTEAEPAATPATAPVEFYAKDRWVAQTHVRAVWNVPHDVAERISDTLEKMAHTGPVRVLVHPDISEENVPPASNAVPGDGFVIMPFSFVKV